MSEEGQVNTIEEILTATYIKIPVELLFLLYNLTQEDSEIIQDKYGKMILELLQNGELC